MVKGAVCKTVITSSILVGSFSPVSLLFSAFPFPELPAWTAA